MWGDAAGSAGLWQEPASRERAPGAGVGRAGRIVTLLDGCAVFAMPFVFLAGFMAPRHQGASGLFAV